MQSRSRRPEGSRLSRRRFFLLDLGRHPLPLALFRTFLAPLVSRIVAADGKVSIRRSYTPAELRNITVGVIVGSGASFRHHVSPFYIRQTVGIWYGPLNAQLRRARSVIGPRRYRRPPRRGVKSIYDECSVACHTVADAPLVEKVPPRVQSRV